MEVAPNNDYLIAEAKLDSRDINALLMANIDLLNYNTQHINHLLDAKVNLTSYSNRRYGKLKGSVYYVSADATTDPRYGIQFYSIKVMISKNELQKRQNNFAG